MSDKPVNSKSVEGLLALNVGEYTEKKGKFTYLSWSWAWTEALKQDPKATYDVRFFGDKCFMDVNGTAMVFVTTTLFGKPMTCQLAVMDHNNRAIKNPDAVALNNSIMRCMVKSLALHGLGLYLYAGEDLPEGEDVPTKPKEAPKVTTAAKKPQLPIVDSTDWGARIEKAKDRVEVAKIYKSIPEADQGDYVQMCQSRVQELTTGAAA